MLQHTKAGDSAGANDQIALGINAQTGAPSMPFGHSSKALPESPLEFKFWLWWQYVNLGMRAAGGPFLRLTPQHPVQANGATYRLDFAIPSCGVGVEVDGHAFHEKTRTQVETRDRRDRDLQSAGWRVFHFSGSELSKHPAECVAEVWSAAADADRATKGAA